MDPKLKAHVERWSKLIEKVVELRYRSDSLGAASRALYAKLYLGTLGQGTEAHRKALVQSSEDWVVVEEGVIQAESDYLRAKLKLDLQVKAFEAEYLTYKIEMEHIRKS